MKKINFRNTFQKSIVICLVIPVLSCSSLMNKFIKPEIDSYTKSDVNFEAFNNISVITFNSNYNKITGNEISDLLTIEFMKKNYNLVERNHMKNLIDEKVLSGTGLTEANKSALKVSGINAIVTGSFSYSQNKIEATKENEQPSILSVASISIKMLNVNTGEIIWTANGSFLSKDPEITTQKLLKDIITEISDKIPESKKKRFWFF